MRICWDNLEGLRYNKKTGRWRDSKKKRTYKLKICKECGEEFLTYYNSSFCCLSCSLSGKNNPFYGKHHTEETRKKLSERRKGKYIGENNPMFGVHRYGKDNPMYGKHHTEETKKKLSEGKMKDKNPNWGKHLSEEHRRKISESNKEDKAYWYGKHLSKETRKKISEANRGKCIGNNHPGWKGGVKKNGLPLYDTYAHQIDWIEEVRRSPEDENILEVKCTYCGKWFIPKPYSIYGRLVALKSNNQGEQRLYCSEGCKQACPIYGKKAQTLMREDDIRSGKEPWWELNREVQPELRQMVLERDEYQCQKCGTIDKPLHCHHILPVAVEPLLSADIDNCITLCEKCHKAVHKLPGCGYGQLNKEIC